MRTAIPRLTIALLMLAGSSLVWAQDATPTSPSDKSAASAPDNTGKNERDRNPSEATADQQKDNSADMDLARQIRKALVEDKSLSTYAHNIKVIAQDGVVTLKGPVKTEQEKQSIEAKAAEVAGGADKVKSEIEVVGKS